MNIGSVSPAKRCEICHQEDCLDSATGTCSRCAQAGIQVTNIQVDLAKPILDEISLKEEAQYKARIANAEALMIEQLIAYAGTQHISVQELRGMQYPKLSEHYQQMMKQAEAKLRRSNIISGCLLALLCTVILGAKTIHLIFFLNGFMYLVWTILVLASFASYDYAKKLSKGSLGLIEANNLLQSVYGQGYMYKLFHAKGEKK